MSPVVTEDRRLGDRRHGWSQWLEGADRRHNAGRRFSDAPRVNPVASILGSLAADPNIAPEVADVFADLSPSLEQLRYEVRTDPENQPFRPCRWGDV